MGDIAVENYKKSVTKVVDKWSKAVGDIGKKLSPVLDELSKLQAIKSPTDADKKKIADLRKKCDALQKEIDAANIALRLEMMAIQPLAKADPKDKELIQLPDWIAKLIKDKGVAVGKSVVLAPTVKFNFKALKLDELGVKVTIRF